MIEGLNPYSRYRASGIQWLGHVPEHWDVRRGKSLFTLRTEKSGESHGMELLSVYTHIGVRPRRSLPQVGNKASSTDGYWIVRRGDIVLNKILAWMGAVGISEFEGVTSPAYDVLRPRTSLCSKYYHYLFRTAICRECRQSRGSAAKRSRLARSFLCRNALRRDPGLIGTTPR